MNDAEKKKMLMYEDILTFLKENREVTTGILGINSNVSKLYRIMDEIRNTEKLVSSETLKRTLKVNEARESLITNLMSLVSILFRFAKDSNDLLLKERTKLSRGNLALYKNYEVINKAILISSLAEKYVRHLHKYGVRNSTIISLNNQIELFQSISNDNGSGPETAAFILEKLFVQADTYITNIDDIIENFIEDEVFYEEYQWVKDQQFEEELEDKEELLYELEENS